MFNLTVDRLCRVRPDRPDDGLHFRVDADGFLDPLTPLATNLEELAAGVLLPPTVAAQLGALVLLGEPGLGKTTALKAITSKVGGAPPQWIDGSDLDEDSFDERVGTILRSLPAADGPAEVDHRPRVTLVLDQLDESPIVRRIPRLLRRLLADRDTNYLRLLVGCRTADLPDDLQGTLKAVFRDYYVADLAPLRRTDAESLVASLGLDGEAIVAHVVDSGAGMLGAVPLTLGLLVQVFRETGSLEGGPKALFTSGVAHLLAEPDPHRASHQVSTLDQRIAIAERIAALVLVSGRRTVWQGPDLKDGDFDVVTGVLTGGFEATDAGPFPVDKQLVKETLATAMFSARGEHRSAFVHSSYAAFLAARYLHQRQLPRRQLEGLFLDAAPDGSRTIPTPIREVAAWLADLDPSIGTWLASVDPRSLVGHDRLLTTDEMRALVVDGLLQRADEFELGERAWTRQVDVAHPGLADQLLVVLEAHDAEPEWPAFARTRLALRLAGQARSTVLAGRLLDIAESDDWRSHLRSMAAEAGLANDHDVAVPRLRSLLDRLRELSYARQADPEDELKAHLLEALWPNHMRTDEVLPLLTPRRRTNFLGMYWSFLRDFVSRLAEDDLVAVLAWATTSAAESAETDDQPEDDNEDLLPEEQPIGQLDATVADALLDRVLLAPDIRPFLGALSSLVLPRLSGYERLTLPEALDDSTLGQDAALAVAEKRRLFAEALVRRAQEVEPVDRGDAWHLINGWTGRDRWRLDREDESPPPRNRLLDWRDFSWVLERAASLELAGERDLARAMAEVAGLIFNTNDVPSIDIASQQVGAVTWDVLGPWFEAIPLDGPVADRWREIHQMERDAESDEAPATAPGFATELQSWLHRTTSGEPSLFWLLAWNLQFPPETGRGQVRRDDRLVDFPGVQALGPDPAPTLAQAGLAFLLADHDHADEWLGSDRYDKRAWAGYLALSLLEERDELDSLPPTRLASWAGAVLWFHSVPMETGDEERKQRLLRRVASSVPVRLGHLIRLHLRGEVRSGRHAWELRGVDPSASPYLIQVWSDLLAEVKSALVSPRGSLTGMRSRLNWSPKNAEDVARLVSVWEMLFERQARMNSPAAEHEVRSLLTASRDERAQDIAARGIEIVVSEVQGAWTRFFAALSTDPGLGRVVACRIASSHREIRFSNELSEDALGELYLWLSELFPPSEDRLRTGTHFVSAEEQARRWRDNVLTILADRSSDEAVVVLSALRDRFSDQPVVLSSLLRARANRFASAWVAPTPSDVQQLLDDAARRFVRSSEELAALIEETIEDIAEGLMRTGELLWDRHHTAPGDPEQWLPKFEAPLSNYLTHDLGLRLAGRALAVNREVLVKPTNAYGAGDRTDILVEATVGTDRLGAPRPMTFRVVVEVKGAWNAGVLTDMRTQLVERYLPEAKANAGVYVVGWYPPELWWEGDYRRRRVVGTTLRELQSQLHAQSTGLRTEGRIVRAMVIEIPRPN